VNQRPESNEFAPYYSRYIDRVAGDDVLNELTKQYDAGLALFAEISEEESLYRYAPEKWSIRQVLSHINDCERVFVFRAFWFARGFDSPLPSFDQDKCMAGAPADDVSWADHVDEFRAVRLATLSLFRQLPQEAWARTGVASGNPFTVRSLAFITAGHFTHHQAILEESYLPNGLSTKRSQTG
jgi:hypothetical protein